VFRSRYAPAELVRVARQCSVSPGAGLPQTIVVTANRAASTGGDAHGRGFWCWQAFYATVKPAWSGARPMEIPPWLWFSQPELAIVSAPHSLLQQPSLAVYDAASYMGRKIFFQTVLRARSRVRGLSAGSGLGVPCSAQFGRAGSPPRAAIGWARLSCCAWSSTSRTRSSTAVAGCPVRSVVPGAPGAYPAAATCHQEQDEPA
jgi:hypothetical protein